MGRQDSSAKSYPVLIMARRKSPVAKPAKLWSVYAETNGVKAPYVVMMIRYVRVEQEKLFGADKCAVGCPW